MSIIIGTVCPEAIVIAADSHTINQRSGTFAVVDKISIVRFWVDEVIIGQAGLWTATNRVVKHLKQDAKGKRISNELDVVDTVENAVRSTTHRMTSAEKDHLREVGAQLLIAFYIEKKPFLYVMDICDESHRLCTPLPLAHFTTLGIGSYLADYLMREYAPQKVHSDLAIATSIFTIKKVKDTTKYCGGETMVKRIAPTFQMVDLDKQYISKSQAISQDFVNLTEKRLVKFDEKTKKSRDKQVFEILRKTGSELWQKHVEKVQKEQDARLNALPKNNPAC